jgi:hypothetical protein
VERLPAKRDRVLDTLTMFYIEHHIIQMLYVESLSGSWLDIGIAAGYIRTWHRACIRVGACPRTIINGIELV